MKKFTDFSPSLTGKFSFSKFLSENKEPNIKDKKLDAFYDTLEAAVDSGKEFKEESNHYTYSKEVENVQAALNFLGYELPRYGVDGKFGPETGAAVAKFKKDHPIAVKLGKAILERDAADAFILGVRQAGGEVPREGEIDGGGPITDDIAKIFPNVVSEIEKLGIEVKVSGANDMFHQGRNSRHTKGEAVDFTISPNSTEARIAVEKVIRNFMATLDGLSYINEYDKPSAHATGGHFHISFRPGDPENGGIGLVGNDYVPAPVKIEGTDLVGIESGEVITPNFIKALIDMLMKKGFTEDDLENYSKKLGPSVVNLDIKDFDGIVAQVIDKLEGGYYHPDMLADGRIKDSRYGNSGETMMGIDRVAGGSINTTPEGVEFWKMIDAANARQEWDWGYRGGALEDKLRDLAGKMIKRNYDKYAQQYLSSKALDIVNNDPRLLFNFVYAVWNGPGWFQRFAKVINDAVNGGETDPATLAQIAVKTRVDSDNSLIAQGGRKIDGLLGTQVA